MSEAPRDDLPALADVAGPVLKHPKPNIDDD